MYTTLPVPENDVMELREDWSTCAMHTTLPVPENDVMELRENWSTCAVYPYLKSASYNLEKTGAPVERTGHSLPVP